MYIDQLNGAYWIANGCIQGTGVLKIVNIFGRCKWILSNSDTGIMPWSFRGHYNRISEADFL